MMKRGITRTVNLNERLPGDLGGLARENPDSNQFMHQTAYPALRPLVMMSMEKDTDNDGGIDQVAYFDEKGKNSNR